MKKDSVPGPGAHWGFNTGQLMFVAPGPRSNAKRMLGSSSGSVSGHFCASGYQLLSQRWGGNGGTEEVPGPGDAKSSTQASCESYYFS